MAAMRLGSASRCWRNTSSPALTRARSSARSLLYLAACALASAVSFEQCVAVFVFDGFGVNRRARGEGAGQSEEDGDDGFHGLKHNRDDGKRPAGRIAWRVFFGMWRQP